MKKKTVYVCSECDYQSAKWLGRCPSCGAWNTFVEETYEEAPAAGSEKKTAKRLMLSGSGDSAPEKLDALVLPEYMRTKSGMGEFDRVLGGGIVTGSVSLLSGEPGIGKSTLLLQICRSIAESKRVLYVSGEESVGQISMRAKRLGIKSDNIYVLAESDAAKIISHCEKLKPDVMIIDSIQTMYHNESASVPGSVTQIRESASIFINKAKSDGTSIILAGHVNKEGSIAGPKTLEHMVDTVLYFEGEPRQSFRVIRAVKNRFGSTNEIGVFEMTDAGLREVENPSEALLADRPAGVSGNCAVCVIEGTRPIIAEIQALTTATVYPSPRRMSAGMDYNRMALILAILEKRLGLRFSSLDVYLNVIGGLHIEETASDLGVALSLISCIRDVPVPDDVLCIGELGLSGECRAVSRLEWRVREAARLGFRRIYAPARGASAIKAPDGVKIVPVRSIFDILSVLAPKKASE